MKVLIIEDDLIQATSLRFQLEQLLIINISVVHDGKSAIEILDDSYYDLVFCDIRMPGMDGIKLLSTQINIEQVGGIIITSSVQDNILEVTRGVCNLVGYDFVDVMGKPFTFDSVRDVIDRYKKYKNVRREESTAVKLTARDIQEAFIYDRLFLCYQPQFNFRTGELEGVEALVRMEHPLHGTVPPNEFLPLIEELGYAKELFALVLTKSTKAITSSSCQCGLSVNISQSLLDSELCDLVLGICTENGFLPSRLTIELTEEQAYTSSAQSLANLARLRLYDIQIAIDDFGTGFASLDKLVDFPFTELKIDRKFISHVAKNYKLQQITFLALKLAQSLGMNCVAEGVEDRETWEYLKELGVDVCQGYYTGKPVHMNDICKLADIYQVDSNALQQNYKHTTVLVCDKYSESALALCKSIEKNLIGSKVLIAKDTTLVLKKLRDLPVNVLVCDIELFEEIEQKIEGKILSDLSLILLSSDTVLAASTESRTVIQRQPEFGYLTKTIVAKIESIVYSEDSLNTRFSMLSQREVDVAKLLIAGFSNKYISYELGINQKTVSTYKSRVLQKLNIKSTVELARFFDN